MKFLLKAESQIYNVSKYIVLTVKRNAVTCLTLLGHDCFFCEIEGINVYLPAGIEKLVSKDLFAQ